MRELWTGSVIAALIVGVARLGPDPLAGRPAPEARRRAAPADGVQPAAGDRLHDPAVPDHRGAVLLHRRRRRTRCRSAAPTPTRRSRSRRSSGTGSSSTPTPRARTASRSARSAPATEIPILVLPTDRTIRFEVASADVIHSFWVPEFLFKLDVIPGNENGRDNVFQVTVQRGGRLRRPLRRAVRHLPRVHELRGPRGVRRRLRRLPRRPASRACRRPRRSRAIGQPGDGDHDAAVRVLQNGTSTSRPPVAERARRPEPDVPTHEEARP